MQRVVYCTNAEVVHRQCNAIFELNNLIQHLSPLLLTCNSFIRVPLCGPQQSLDSRHRLLCKQREDAKDLKDNLDRRENLVSTFLSRQLSAEQLQDYRRFVQTKASLLIRQKDLEEKQRLGEEQLDALCSCLRL